MPEAKECPQCGAKISGDGPKGKCPACLIGLAVGMGTSGTDALESCASQTRVSRYFGDYELLEEIARGGMGIVFKARQGKLDRLVAVKMILAGEFASREQALRFRAEVEAAARLQHRNIVRIHETGEQDGQPYFSMDYVEGGNLAMLVREKPLPAKRAAGYVKTIAEAIHYAHEQGILHRDLKPSNVLIDSNDQLHVTDFGLAKRMQKESFLTVTGDVMGSPSFMPPEQAGAKSVKAGRYSDVYGLGAILFYLITGRPPFVAESAAETLHHVLNTEPVSPRLLNPSVPEDIATVCLQCLEKDTGKRFQTAQQVAEELGRFLRDEPILAPSAKGPNFNQMHWANSEFAHGYLDQADEIVPMRRYLFRLLLSFLESFRSAGSLRVCDLGCGDGTLGEQIRTLAVNAHLTLVDGSAEMLEIAQRRLGQSSNIRFVHAAFDAVFRGDIPLGPFDFVVSSFAIHHLNTSERTALFFRILQQLEPGGWFVNIDIGLPDGAAFTEWQFDLWREWITDREGQQCRTDSLRDVPDLARREPDNKFSSLTGQLNSLRSVGFAEVECLYRHSVFVLYCGRKPAVAQTASECRAVQRMAEGKGTKDSERELRIALVGDYHAQVASHRAILRALELLSAEEPSLRVEPEWILTRDLKSNPAERLSRVAGIWCVPASPYASMDGALRAIQIARERGVPFLGTCAGFQHALIEYARHVIGLQEADHAETNPATIYPLISRLACPLIEQEGPVLLAEGSRLREICGGDSSVETYHCRFGLDRAFEARLNDGRLRVCGRNPTGDIHAVELMEHPFYLATLFQPERWALRGKVHPLIRAFVQAALAQS
jgi:serine/threonine protein kinase